MGKDMDEACWVRCNLFSVCRKWEQLGFTRQLFDAEVSDVNHLEWVRRRDKTNGLEMGIRGDRVRRSRIGRIFDREERGRREGGGKGSGLGIFWEEGGRIYFGKWRLETRTSQQYLGDMERIGYARGFVTGMDMSKRELCRELYE